ncbi:heavy metal translocating P-type ATPase [Halomonas koreensis]|uniref:P-type Zn(2+) transporter n=1 Tax=Halomonas koreensis TaxID=245385 RepID=A0ABU1FYV6_9GAMM|nr:cation-translocating P-type ATPase [Halomonas koreensis]MDR5865422.1 cation-translocating P-type ATPase [Halomonas koreensis]
MADTSQTCSGGCGDASPAREAVAAPPGTETLRRRITEMDCPTEEALLRKALDRVPGVAALDFDLMGRVLSVHHRDADPAAVDRAIRDAGMTPRPLDADAPREAPAPRPWGRLAVAALLALGAELVGWTATPAAGVMAPLLALAAIALVGLPTWRKGWVALRHRSLNINALMSVAVTGALLIGHWAEAAMVMVLFTLAEHLEARSLERARGAIRALLDKAPAQARRQGPDGGWVRVPAGEVAVGETVRVLPGERLPLDGEVVRGTPTLDESPITGESRPRDKAPGEAVFAGTVNRHGDFDLRVTRPADDSTLARIIQAVEAAQAARAPTQRFIDRFSAVYTPAVLGLALLTALAWPLLFPGAWLDGVYRALVLLVIACPCALVISTPVSIVSGLSAAARAGILIKGGRFLEQGHRLTWLALDKTGTLTRGEPRLADWQPLGVAGSEPARIAAGLAARSTHPVSRALHAALGEDGAAAEVSELRERPGLGVEGEVDGRRWWLGNRRLMAARGLVDPTLEPRLDALAERGDSVVLLGDAEAPRALFVVRDMLRPGAREAVTALHELGVRTCMLSGDSQRSVAAIAAEAGIDEARGELLPEDKLAAIERLGGRGVIGMVGDGINDAPALARADIGFAMGAAGSDAAIETADVALMDDDPGKLPTFLRLSRATRRVLIQNIVLALGLKAVFLALAFAGQATLWMAVFADMGASLLVVANGLRLLGARRP